MREAEASELMIPGQLLYRCAGEREPAKLRCKANHRVAVSLISVIRGSWALNNLPPPPHTHKQKSVE